MPLHPTQRLQSGRYVLLGALNSGGEAEVWRALDTSCGEERALKVWRTADGGADAAARELAIGRRIAHPHVVRVEDAFVEGDHAFAVMELAEGSLAERIATLGPLSPVEALAALAYPVRALAEAHAAGLVHRDVKPHNLLVFGDLAGAFGVDGAAVVKLGDFGIAQLRAEGMTRTRSGTLLGSLPFMSPEQRRDPKRVGPATDVYAMAVTLAWLVTGEAPGDLYLEATIAELRERLRARGVSDVDNALLCDAVARGGALAPEARGSLEAWWHGVGTPAEAGTGVQRQGREVGAGGSRPPQRPPVVPETGAPSAAGRSTPPRIAWATAGAALVAAGAAGGALVVAGATSPGEAAPAATSEAQLPPCEEIAEDYVTVRTNGPREVVAASFDDLDDDGFDDALFVSQLDEQVLVYRGGPNPKLDSPLVIPIERAGVPVHAVDVDGDGRKDLLALHQDSAKWKAYGLDANFNVTWTKQWQEELGAATGWDVVTETDGVKVLYGSNSNECLLERTLRAGALGMPTCRWASQYGPVVSVLARGTRAAAVFAERGTRVLGSKIVADAAHPAALLRRLPGRVWPSWGTNDERWFALIEGPERRGLLQGLHQGEADCSAALPAAEPEDLGDWNGDGVMDALLAESCAECTSNLVVYRGMPQPD